MTFGDVIWTLFEKCMELGRWLVDLITEPLITTPAINVNLPNFLGGSISLPSIEFSFFGILGTSVFGAIMLYGIIKFIVGIVTGS